MELFLQWRQRMTNFDYKKFVELMLWFYWGIFVGWLIWG